MEKKRKPTKIKAIDEETKESIIRNIGEIFPGVADLSFFRQVFESKKWDVEKSIKAIKHFLEDADSKSMTNGPFTKNNNDFNVKNKSKQRKNTAKSETSAPKSSGNSVAKNDNNSPKTGTIPKSSKVTKSDKKVAPLSKLSKKEVFCKTYDDIAKLPNPVHRISSYVLEGIKVMIIMRGCPGSGKSYLVNHLATSLSRELSKSQGNTSQADHIGHHIFSADDFWVNPRTNKYIFNSEYIEFAHLWNQKLVRQAASEGRSPIFVDNTHTRTWEMQKVVAIALEFGYVIEIIEPPNKWALNENELVRRNVHGVHKDAMKRMLDRYEHHITPLKIMSTYNMSYPDNLKPPQRCVVSFSTVPSKSQTKYFNSRFYCAPLETILLLKQGAESSAGSGEPITDTNSIAPTLSANKLKKEVAPNNPNLVFSNSSLFGGTDSQLNQKQGKSNALNDVRFLNSPTKLHGSQDILMPSVIPNKPSKGQDVLKKKKLDSVSNLPNLTQKPPQSSSISSVELIDGLPQSSVDLLKSLNEETLKALLDHVATSQQHQKAPEKFEESPHFSKVADNSLNRSNELRKNSLIDSSWPSADLLSFDEDVVTLPNNINVQHSREHDSYEDEVSSDSRVYVYSDESDISDDDSSDSSSCENVTIPSPFDACDEFGFGTTREYAVVQPDGSLKYQYQHDNCNNSFLKSLRTEKLNDDVVSKIKNLIKTPFLKGGKFIDDMSTNLGNSRDSVSGESATTGGLTTGTDGKFVKQVDHYDGQAPLMSATSTPSTIPFKQVDDSSKSSGGDHPVQRASSKEQLKQELMHSTFAQNADPKNPIPAATRNNSDIKDKAPNQSVRSLAQKVQKPASRQNEFCSNTNYMDFDTLSKVNAGTYVGDDKIRIGRASSFKSGTTPQKFDDIKMIATHEKSSMTTAESLTVEKDSGLEILTRMFPSASVDALEELFEKCHKDLDWTVNLIMDSGLEISESFIADGLAKIATLSQPSAVEPNDCDSAVQNLPPPSSAKKPKKTKHKLTGDLLNIVKEFEGSFVLSEDSYSHRIKKVRETKFGKPVESGTQDDNGTRDFTPSTESDCFNDSYSVDDDEGDMNFIMPNAFMAQLQDKFGCVPNLYGDDELVVKIPVSLARQIYSYALDSICQHMEDQQNVINLLIKEDEAFARKLQGESKGSDNVTFQEIMDHEMALRSHQKRQISLGANNEATFASTLSHQLLAERFPNMDPATLKVVLDDTNQSLHQATNLLAAAGHVPVDPIALELEKSYPVEEPEYKMTREESIQQANAYHEVAVKLNDLRKHYLTKTQESYRSGNLAVAMFYREMFNWYSDRIKESNSMAAKAMLYGNEEATTLDLHFLGVAESVRVLDLFLDEAIRKLKTRKRDIFIITGRGLHSADGKSKIKPVIKQRLNQRGLKCHEINPGMLKTVINKSSTESFKLDKMSQVT